MAPRLLDMHGRPIVRSVLTEELSAATMGGVRSPVTSYPGDGLDPRRLTAILQAADQGDPVAYLELAQTIEERDLHYVGVMGTRRRSVTQIPITVTAASDSPEDVARAKMVRRWLDRDELQSELFDILDCIGKGYSATEIIWDTSMGQWQPLRLEYRDPRWFRFADHDLTTPMRLDADGTKIPLEPFKFIWARIQAKSGLPLRGGLARVAMWAYLFKKYTERDWAVFTQTFGQPVRVGKFNSNASDDDKKTLMRAVANIAGDMAAIIPDTMIIEFIQAAQVGASSALYLERANWLDMQVSKAVLGQTATTDAVTGGLGSGKEHREVQEDIQRSDARALAGILNRDLVIPWMQLQYGPLPAYPKIKIEHPEEEDLKGFSDAIGPLVDRGMRVSLKSLHERFSIPEAQPNEPVLTPMARAQGVATTPNGSDAIIERQRGVFERGDGVLRAEAAKTALAASTGEKTGGDPVDVLTERLGADTAPLMDRLMAQIEAMTQAATSLPELREMLLSAFPDLETGDLSRVIAQGLLAANLGGQVEVTDEDANG